MSSQKQQPAKLSKLDQLRERAALASFGPVGVAALEEPATFDTLADLADVRRGTGFGPGWSVGATLLLGGAATGWGLLRRTRTPTTV